MKFMSYHFAFLDFYKNVYEFHEKTQCLDDIALPHCINQITLYTLKVLISNGMH